MCIIIAKNCNFSITISLPITLSLILLTFVLVNENVPKLLVHNISWGLKLRLYSASKIYKKIYTNKHITDVDLILLNKSTKINFLSSKPTLLTRSKNSLAFVSGEQRWNCDVTISREEQKAKMVWLCKSPCHNMFASNLDTRKICRNNPSSNRRDTRPK